MIIIHLKSQPLPFPKYESHSHHLLLNITLILINIIIPLINIIIFVIIVTGFAEACGQVK